jgi:hypothetical protein
LSVVVALSVGAVARAHVLGGGGRPSSSGGGSSGGTWNQLDPAQPAPGTAATPEQAALSAQLQKMKAYCDTVDESARQSCYGTLAMSASAVAGIKPALDAQQGAARGATAQTKLDQERGTEAQRLKTERSHCDSLEGLDGEACYEELSATHDSWHARHDPMEGVQDSPDLKKLSEARGKCLKLKDAKKRRQCLRDLVKKRKLQRSDAQPHADTP